MPYGRLKGKSASPQCGLDYLPGNIIRNLGHNQSCFDSRFSIGSLNISCMSCRGHIDALTGIAGKVETHRPSRFNPRLSAIFFLCLSM